MGQDGKVQTFRCGHEKTPENARTKPNGSTMCRICGRAAARRWKARNVGQQREYNHDYGMAPENRGICESPVCARLRGSKALRSRPDARGYCAECAQAVADVRRTVAEGMWADGWTISEIGAAMGVGPTYVQAMRARGWDLPHRRTPEQVERIRAGRWAA